MDLERPYIFKLRHLISLYNLEVQALLLRIDLDMEFDSYLKFTDSSGSNLKLATIGQTDSKGVFRYYLCLRIASAAYVTRSIDHSISVELFGNLRDRLIKIASVELESPRLPLLSIQHCIQYPFLCGKADTIFDNRHGKILLDSTIDPK